MSINITDKVADTVEVLIENTNQAITTVNNQLDVSVLANLKTTNKDTLVNAINDLVDNKLGIDTDTIDGDLTINGSLTANNIKIQTDENGNSVVLFYDTTSSSYVRLFWNNSLRKWQLSFPDGSIVDILNSNDLEEIQNQIDDISSKIDYNFNTNGKTLILKQLSDVEIAKYVGPAGEIVINTDNWGEIRIQDGTTVGGNVISGSFVADWKPNTKINKGQCVHYGNSLYRSKSTHITTDEFQIDLYDIIASYKKYIESQKISDETNKISLTHSVQNKNDFDVNIGGLVIHKSNYEIIDSFHIRFSENIPSGTDIEITYYEASNLINSSNVVISYEAPSENTIYIPIQEQIEDRSLINQINIENTVLLNTEWTLDNENLRIILKNPIDRGSRVQVSYWKSVQVAQNGITFTPKVTNGILSWTNDGGLENPETINIATINTKQNISGEKTFSIINVPTKDRSDNSEAAASTAFVKSVIEGNFKLPNMEGNEGKFLTNDGNTSFWTDVNTDTYTKGETNNLLNTKQLLSNLSQSLDNSTSKYPCNKAVKTITDNINSSINTINSSINTINSNINIINSKIVPVGTLTPFASNTIPTGWLKCDGSAVSRTTYAELFRVIGTTYGAGNNTSTFNLPNFLNKTFWGSASSGTSIQAGLPNITGSYSSAFGTVNRGGVVTGYGCFSDAPNVGDGDAGNGAYTNVYIKMDASRSNAIYGKSSTVQPPAIQTIILIKY